MSNQFNKTIPLYDQVKFEIWNSYRILNSHINKYLTYTGSEKRANYIHLKRYFREFMQILITKKKLSVLKDKRAERFLLHLFYNANRKLTTKDIYLIQGLSAQILEEYGLTNFELQEVNLMTYLVDEDEE